MRAQAASRVDREAQPDGFQYLATRFAELVLGAGCGAGYFFPLATALLCGPGRAAVSGGGGRGQWRTSRSRKSRRNLFASPSDVLTSSRVFPLGWNLINPYALPISTAHDCLAHGKFMESLGQRVFLDMFGCLPTSGQRINHQASSRTTWSALSLCPVTEQRTQLRVLFTCTGPPLRVEASACSRAFMALVTRTDINTQ